MENNDDGSLGFLNIQPDEDRKYFHCEEITQQKLLNKSFWVIDFIGIQKNITAKRKGRRERNNILNGFPGFHSPAGTNLTLNFAIMDNSRIFVVLNWQSEHHKLQMKVFFIPYRDLYP